MTAWAVGLVRAQWSAVAVRAAVDQDQNSIDQTPDSTNKNAPGQELCDTDSDVTGVKAPHAWDEDVQQTSDQLLLL